MYLLSICICPNEGQKADDYEKFTEEMNWYFGALIKNGQALSNDCTTIIKDDKFITYLLAPEQDSLKTENSNIYVSKFYSEMAGLCKSEPIVELIGKSSDYELSCDCVSPAWYMLYSDYTTNNESPVVCGDCGRTVPLYRLPKILGEDEYYSVLGWQKAYNACDDLFMKGIGERFAYRKLSKYSSDLTRKGLEICNAFEDATKKPFYYYLFRYYSHHKNTCPSCGGLWEIKDQKSTFVDYRCNTCRLVADKV